ncbi:ribose-phosphate diphosphokinase [Candidatus Woesearchaeota archaeon]|nr:ribose-phosphate diphosphokinase [Candidatus Woesearchaeota archaeon]
MIIAGMSNSKDLAEKIARRLNVDYDDLILRDFSDGELHVKFNCDVKGKKVALVQSLYPYPNHSFFEVMYAASAARDLGAKEIIYVAPYIAFFREDNRKVGGECVQQNIVADLLNRNVDAVLSVEPHLHQHNLPGKFSIPFYRLECNEALRKYARDNFSGCKIVGFGERAWKLAKHVDKNAALYEKGNHGNVNEDKIEYGDNVLIVDDIIASGNSMMANIANLKCKKINVLAVHGLFNGDSFLRLKGIAERIVSCNTVRHESNKIDVSGLIAGKLMEI